MDVEGFAQNLFGKITVLGYEKFIHTWIYYKIEIKMIVIQNHSALYIILWML